MARRTRSIGVASRKCRMINKKTGKRIRTKAERKRCMKRALKGGRKLGRGKYIAKAWKKRPRYIPKALKKRPGYIFKKRKRRR